MNTLSTWIKRNAFVVFVILSCALSWWLLPLGIEGLAVLPLGPLLAALIVIPFINGKEGLKEWGRTGFRWRVSPLWYVVAIAFPIVVNAAAAGVNILLGATASTDVWPTSLMAFLPEALLTILIVAVGEEMGFSAFGLPHLLGKHTALMTAVLLGLTRIIWHVPLFMVGDTAWPVALLLIPAQVVFTWIFISGRRSALLIILSHGAMATVAFPFFSPIFTGPDLARLVWIQVAMFTLAAVIVLLISKPMRSTRPLADPLAGVEEPAVIIP